MSQLSIWSVHPLVVSPLSLRLCCSQYIQFLQVYLENRALALFLQAMLSASLMEEVPSAIVGVIPDLDTSTITLAM